MSAGNAIVEGINQALSGSVSDNTYSGSATGSVTGAQNGSVYEISSSQGSTISAYDTTAALNQVHGAAQLGLSALNNAVQGSESVSSGLANGVQTALQNRSQSATQSLGKDGIIIAALAAAAFGLWVIFRR